MLSMPKPLLLFDIILVCVMFVSDWVAKNSYHNFSPRPGLLDNSKTELQKLNDKNVPARPSVSV